jgi:hypothetical protein
MSMKIHTVFVWVMVQIRGRDSSGGGGLQAGRPRFDPRRGKIFPYSTAFRPALGPTQPPTKWVPGTISPGVKRQRPEADHSPPCTAEVKNGGAIPPLHRNNFTCKRISVIDGHDPYHGVVPRRPQHDMLYTTHDPKQGEVPSCRNAYKLLFFLRYILQGPENDDEDCLNS